MRCKRAARASKDGRLLRVTGPRGRYAVLAGTTRLSGTPYSASISSVVSAIVRHNCAMLSSMNPAQVRAFFFPDNPRRIRMRDWRHLWEYLRAVERAPLGISEKLPLHVLLVRLAVYKRQELAGELFAATRQLLAGAFR